MAAAASVRLPCGPPAMEPTGKTKPTTAAAGVAEETAVDSRTVPPTVTDTSTTQPRAAKSTTSAADQSETQRAARNTSADTTGRAARMAAALTPVVPVTSAGVAPFSVSCRLPVVTDAMLMLPRGSTPKETTLADVMGPRRGATRTSSETGDAEGVAEAVLVADRERECVAVTLDEGEEDADGVSERELDSDCEFDGVSDALGDGVWLNEIEEDAVWLNDVERDAV